MQSDTLRLFRMAKNQKQKVIADLLGMSQANYSNLENGKIKINSQCIKILACYYGVEAAVFLETEPFSNLPLGKPSPSANQIEPALETNEALLDPILNRMEVLLNLLSDEKEELANERRQLSAVFEKLADRFEIRL
jgi:transcriptional regulator with XRE-family HTH domain